MYDTWILPELLGKKCFTNSPSAFLKLFSVFPTGMPGEDSASVTSLDLSNQVAYMPPTTKASVISNLASGVEQVFNLST